MTPQELRRRTYQFALRALLLFKALPKTSEAQVIGRQLLRASTGVAANYRAAGRGRSHKEFTAKIGVVLEEADESVLWLRLLIDGKIQSGQEVQDLLTEGRELTAVFAASWQTAKRRLKGHSSKAGSDSTGTRKAPRSMDFDVSKLGKSRRVDK